MKLLLAALWWAAWCALAAAQPHCTLDAHCLNGSYCVPGVGICEPCANCTLSGRQRTKLGGECIKSLADCGKCLDGYISDGSAQCVPPARGPPLRVWLSVLLAVLLALCLLIAALAWRYKWTHKIAMLEPRIIQNSETGASGGRGDAERPLHPAGALTPSPPPYNPVYRPSSPPADFDKRFGYDAPTGDLSLGEARIQNAVPWNTPHYVNPPSYDEAFSTDSIGNGGVESADDNTVESVWTPAPASSVQNGGSLSEQLREARDRGVGRQLQAEPDMPPAKISRRNAEEVDLRSRPADEPSAGDLLAITNGTTVGSNSQLLTPFAPTIAIPSRNNTMAVRSAPPGTEPAGAERNSRTSPPPSPPPHRPINNITINFQVNN